MDGARETERLKDGSERETRGNRRDRASELAGLMGNQSLLQRLPGSCDSKGGLGSQIPADIKARAEQKSGLSMEQVNVHYRSPLPAKVGALAYTRGMEVYIGPGQERHLSHELGHVVQQLQGRVRPTGMVAGQPLNDDVSLEREADSYR